MSIDKNNLPLHVAFILDGNGRWAEKRKLSRSAGHDEGLKTIKKIVKDACDLGIKYITLYVFSTENWKRTQDEVGFLMNLIHIHLRNELTFYKENKIKLNHLGDINALPKNIQSDIINAMDDTKSFDKMTVNLAINYGGRDEILRGIKKLFNKKKDLSDFSEKDFSEYLDMKESPDVDLVIRTGGEQRLSNFLLWHVPYAEFIYSDTLWPDYTKDEFYRHIEEFQHRNRRFGAEKSRKQET
ncbi:MAG: di-trans,poly-cis-decaprenylcistransferase [Treponema sp.]|nr:di-trans,poly-cis-decaprenylcistransferase [Treponema sp.]